MAKAKGLWANIKRKRAGTSRSKKKSTISAKAYKNMKAGFPKKKKKKTIGVMATAAWTRKEGKSKSGGLNAKGRASYKKGTLKAPTKSKTSSRRKSFLC